MVSEVYLNVCIAQFLFMLFTLDSVFYSYIISYYIFPLVLLHFSAAVSDLNFPMGSYLILPYLIVFDLTACLKYEAREDEINFVIFDYISNNLT